MSFDKIHFAAADHETAQKALTRLVERYGQSSEAAADVIIALGGDGFMLQTLHRHIEKPKPIYGMNQGTVGFLLNSYSEEALKDRLAATEQELLHPLEMTAKTAEGEDVTALAFNEVSLLRQTRQTAHIRIHVDGRERMSKLVCDGVLLSTPAGSTAYNFSAHGPILPLDSSVLALTPISAFRPRHWRGALLSQKAEIELDILNPAKRPVSAVADSTEVRDILSVRIVEKRSIALPVLFDPEHSYEERVLAEQFTTG